MKWVNDDYSHNLRIYERCTKGDYYILSDSWKCLFSRLALYNKLKCLCVKFVTNRDTFTYHYIIFIFFS